MRGYLETRLADAGRLEHRAKCPDCGQLTAAYRKWVHALDELVGHFELDHGRILDTDYPE